MGNNSNREWELKAVSVESSAAVCSKLFQSAASSGSLRPTLWISSHLYFIAGILISLLSADSCASFQKALFVCS